MKAKKFYRKGGYEDKLNVFDCDMHMGLNEKEVVKMLEDYGRLVLKLHKHDVVLRSEQLQSFVSGFYQWHRQQNYVSVKREDWDEYIKTL